MTRTIFSAFRRALSAALALAAVLALPVAAASQERDRTRGKTGVFDFYVLSLSWSPTFCATAKNERNSQQCGASRQYGFIVHGLWPQHERGYPEFCASGEPGRVPQALGQPLFDIMPSMGLIGHQWRKHGSCSGLAQRDYLAAIRSAYDKITLPPTFARPSSASTLSAEGIEAAFIAANPGIAPQGIAVTCEGEQLEEVRICLTKDFGFRTCPEVDRRSCSRSSITIPPAR